MWAGCSDWGSDASRNAVVPELDPRHQTSRSGHVFAQQSKQSTSQRAALAAPDGLPSIEVSAAISISVAVMKTSSAW